MTNYFVVSDFTYWLAVASAMILSVGLFFYGYHCGQEDEREIWQKACRERKDKP